MSTPRNLSDRYELGETLGFGGMSEVHGGRDMRLDRDVAVKVLRADLARDPSFYLRFRREAQNAAALNHPAIVAVYDTGEADTAEGTLPYIVMELVDGETLRDILRNDGPFSPRRAMEVMGDVCAALDFSHRNGIVHRDVKPANVMINRSGSVKVMDFGIARAMADGASTMTQTASVIGTAQYLSPEQARGEQVDARSDVYSAGCVLYELLAGEPPFTGDSPVAVAYQHVREDPHSPSQVNAEVPATLDSIVLKAMSKNPANRYQTAGDMRADLVRVLAGQRPSAPAIMTDDERTQFIGPVVPAFSGRHRDDDDLDAVGPRRGRRTGVLVLASVAALALLALVGVFLVTFLSPAEPESVAVPDVISQPVTAAQEAVIAAGLVPEVQSVPDPEIAENTVIATVPAAGTRAEDGSTVTLQVSSGPEQVQVPDVAGLTVAQATAAVTDAGLVLAPGDPARAVSGVEQLGQVVEQEPEAGSSVDSGAEVSLTLGGGPEQLNVINVVSQSVEVATSNLTSDDAFVVTQSSQDSSAPAGTVLAQSPEGGTPAPRGSTVNLVVSNGNRVEMPDLVGSTRDQALAVLEGAGWTGGEANLVSTEVPVETEAEDGIVTTQNPATDTDIELNEQLAVEVGQFTPPSSSLPTASVPTPTPAPTLNPTPAPTPTTTASGG